MAWITDWTHFLDEDGDIAPPPGPARRLAEYFAAIIEMTSYSGLGVPPEFRLRCRRRPGRKPCSGWIDSDVDFETEAVVWWCPVCGDNGYIYNWQGSLWDLRGMEERQ